MSMCIYIITMRMYLHLILVFLSILRYYDGDGSISIVLKLNTDQSVVFVGILLRAYR